VPYDGAGQCVASLDHLVNGFLYAEQVKDSGVFRCPDNVRSSKLDLAIGHFPTKPANWPIDPATGLQYPYVTDPVNAAQFPDAPVNVCASDADGLQDCYIQGPLRGRPKYYYTYDSYDIGPRLLPNGNGALAGVYDVHYSLDWTGIRGASDLPDQMKYSNPPSDKTLLTYCSWHVMTYGGNSVPAVQLNGTAKPVDLVEILKHGSNLYNK
jgi:hypothetical protein